MSPRTLLTTLSLAILARAFAPPALPAGWSTLTACAVDDAQRLILGDVTSVVSDLTPAACAASCAAAGFDHAGIEFGDECHCGTGLKRAPDTGPAARCDMPCAGDASFACGGVWSIQVFKLTVAALRPGSWAYEGCVADTAAAPAFANAVSTTPGTNLGLTSQCLAACTHSGFAYAAVRDASVCRCSTTAPVAGAQKVDESECSSLCPLPGNAGFEFCGGVERVDVFRFTG